MSSLDMPSISSASINAPYTSLVPWKSMQYKWWSNKDQIIMIHRREVIQT